MSNADVLFPKLYEIDGRIYCNYNISDHFQHHEDSRDEQYYREDEDDWSRHDYDDGGEEDENEDFQITSHPNGGFVVKLQIPSVLHSYMIGQKHSVKKQMESETGARIQYPPRDSPNNGVTVTSQHKKSVVSCANRLCIMSADVRWKAPFTHFISIRLNLTHVMNSFERFRDEILDNRKVAVDECLFQTANKLHLTLCVLHLLDENELEAGRRLLRNFPYEEIIGNGKLEVDIKGLEVMNDDPSDVDVLYAKVECTDDRLQQLANGIAKHFVNANFAERRQLEDRDVKLHATLINSKFRPSNSTVRFNDKGKRVMKDNYHHGRRQQRESFDATGILNSRRFNNYNFGRVTIDQVLISSRSQFADDGYYATVDQLNMSH